MSRLIVDDDLQTWEVFASTGAFGYPEKSRVVFRCASNDSEPPRADPVAGDKSDAERLVVEASAGELREMLTKAQPLR